MTRSVAFVMDPPAGSETPVFLPSSGAAAAAASAEEAAASALAAQEAVDSIGDDVTTSAANASAAQAAATIAQTSAGTATAAASTATGAASSATGSASTATAAATAAQTAVASIGDDVATSAANASAAQAAATAASASASTASGAASSATGSASTATAAATAATAQAATVVTSAARARKSQWLASPAIMAPRIIATAPTITVKTARTLARPIYAAAGAGGPYFASQSAGSPWTVSRTLPAETTTGGIAFVPRPSITAGLQSAPTDSSLRQFSFMLEDSAFEVMTQSNGNRYFVKVDGEYVTDTLATPNTLYQTATAASQWRKFDFGTRKMRRIDIIGGGGSSDQLSFMGVAISSTGAIYPAPIRGPRVICVGDSFTINALHSWTHWLAEGMGWDDVWTSGVGGTGLLNTSSGTKKTFRQRVATDIVPFAPDIVIMHGGVNDGALGAAAAGAEATAFVQAIKDALPNCLVIGGCNISKGPETLPSTTLDLRDAVKAGFLAGGGVWLDITEQPLSGTPLSGVLSAARTAGTAGNVGTVTVPNGGIGIPCSTGLRVGATVDIGTGATRERKVITGYGSASGQALYAFDGAFLYDHAIGEPIVEVGASYISGRGQIGAGASGGFGGVNGTTGWGTADFWCKSDAVHPTEQDILSTPYTNGQYAIGIAQAAIIRGYLASA